MLAIPTISFSIMSVSQIFNVANEAATDVDAHISGLWVICNYNVMWLALVSLGDAYAVMVIWVKGHGQVPLALRVVQLLGNHLREIPQNHNKRTPTAQAQY